MARRGQRGEHGAVALEFALLLPVLLLFLMGIVEFGRALWTRSILQFAVEEASRYAIAHSTASSATIVAYAQGQVVGVPLADVAITVVSSAADVTVTASTNFQFVGPDLLPFGPLTLTASSRFPR